MNSFWLKFNGRPAGCVEAENESSAVEIGNKETGFEVVSCKTLPYPASPRINQYEHPQHGVCPSFCFKPEQCCGSTACPQRYSCVE